MQTNNGMIECSVCHSKLVPPATKTISRAYDRHKSRITSKQRVLNILLVGGDCMLVGFQVPISFFYFNANTLFYTRLQTPLLFICYFFLFPANSSLYVQGRWQIQF
jgi:hypothetical protein